jgi:hypothetical protein
MVMQVPYFMQVPRLEVLECVSSILNDNGFSPTRECIEIGDLYVSILQGVWVICIHNWYDLYIIISCICSWSHPYEDVLSIKDIPKKSGRYVCWLKYLF